MFHYVCAHVDLNGVDINPVQDTPVAIRKEDTYIHFSMDVEIQRHVEKLPKGNIQSLSISDHYIIYIIKFFIKFYV